MAVTTASQKELLLKYTTPASALDLPKRAKLILYGEPGTWKTTTACRIGADQGRVLHYSMNGDEESYLRFPDIAKNTDVIKHVPGEMRLINAIADRMAEGGYPGYSTFVWDTLDSWVNFFIYEIVTKTKYKSSGNGQNNSRTIIEAVEGVPGSAQFIKDMDLKLTELADYNVVRIHLQPIVNKLIHSGMNIIINCHMKVAEKDKINKDKHKRPNLPEQAFLNTIADMNAMGYLEKGPTGIPTVDFRGSGAVATKSRNEALVNQKFSHPDKFVEAINAYLSS